MLVSDLMFHDAVEVPTVQKPSETLGSAWINALLFEIQNISFLHIQYRAGQSC